MAGLKGVKSALLCVGIVIYLIFLITGCSTLPSERSSSESLEASVQKDKTGPLYYDFGDVLIPIIIYIHHFGFFSRSFSVKGKS
ncbi:MAG: hypothetical protein JRI92_13435 [Deltaproteobacteria bacterium]|nr:hypothetical protein [Deltaproteobacteria bacterium]